MTLAVDGSGGLRAADFFCFGRFPRRMGTLSSQLWLHLFRIVLSSISVSLVFVRIRVSVGAKSQRASRALALRRHEAPQARPRLPGRRH